MDNILTIDVEEWFHANYTSNVFDSSKNYQVRVTDNTMRLLDLFDDYNAKATFFVLGYVAERHPDLIKTIHNRGHEIASHGYGHQLIYNQTPDEFREDVRKSVELLENIIGQAVKGFRAPSWSIVEQSKWAWEVLEELGLKYDASVFPIKNFLYGLPDSPTSIYTPCYKGRNLNLYEIPASTIQIAGKNMPFSGGFYFRVLPYPVIRRCINVLNQVNLPAIIYLHPREIDPNQPRLPLSFKDGLIHYWGIKKCEEKFITLLKDFTFTTISEFYQF